MRNLRQGLWKSETITGAHWICSFSKQEMEMRSMQEVFSQTLLVEKSRESSSFECSIKFLAVTLHKNLNC